MAALEWRIISELLRSKDWQSVVRLGFNAEYLRSEPEAAQIFDHIRAWWHHPDTMGQFPTLQSIKRMWPAFKLLKSEQTDSGQLASLLKECKGLVLEADVRSLVDYFRELVDDDPLTAIEIMQSHLSRLAYQEKGNMGFSLKEIAQDVESHYQGALDGSIYGIPWPWDILTTDTLGKNSEDFIVLYGRMKSMKCVCAGERIMAFDGSLVAIEDLPSTTYVPSYTESTGKIRKAKAQRVVSGVKDCVEVVTESGLRLRTSKEHLYMVPGGYARIKNLRPGDYVATARRLPNWEVTSKLTTDDANLLGLLVGDGNYTRSEVQFTSKDEELVQRIRQHANRFGCSVNQATRDTEYRIVGKNLKNPILDLLRDVGISGTKSAQKRAPSTVFSASKEAIAAFIAGLIDTDGCISSKFSSISSASRGLLEDVQHLLTRFGIRGRIKEVVTNYNTLAYQLYVYSKELNFLLYAAVSPFMCLGYKVDALRRLVSRWTKGKRNTDAIPHTPELEELILRERGCKPWPRTGVSKFDKTKLFTKKGRISRYRLQVLADAFDSEALHHIANKDIVWEQIQSIESIGRVPCYDICIEDGQDPNFVVEGFIVHNTWILLVNAVHDFLHHKKRVLIWSREMNRRKMALRTGSILGGVDYQCLKDGSLPAPLYDTALSSIKMMAALHDKSMEALKKIREGAYEGGQGVPDLLIVSGRDAPMTLEGLDGVVKAFNPDIVYLDSMYHLSCDQGRHAKSVPEHQRALAIGAKQMAINWAIPVVATVQGNRDAEKTHGDTLSDISWTDALAQEADLIIRILSSAGPALFEDDYEGYWAKLKGEMGKVTQPNGERRNGRMRLAMSEEARRKFSRDTHVPNKIQSKFDRLPKKERSSAELFLMMGGSREGTLSGFSIQCVPGYIWDVTRENVSPSEAKELLEAKEGHSKPSTSPKKRKGKGKSEKIIDPVDAGNGFSGLS